MVIQRCRRLLTREALRSLVADLPRHMNVQVLTGRRSSVVLQALNASDPDGGAPGHGGSVGLFPLVWDAR